MIGRIHSEESQMELISFRIILIFIGKISKFCRERREYILERKQIERLAQSFEKMVQMAINKNGAKDDEHSKANY